MEKQSKTNILLVFTMILMVIFFLNQNSKIKNLENKINNYTYHNNDYYTLITEINSLRSQISRMENNNVWIKEKSYNFISLSDDKKNIVTEFTVSFNELFNSSEVYLLVINVDDTTDFQKIKLEESSHLEYKGTVELDINKNFTFDILSENNILSRKESLMRLNIAHMFYLNHRNYINSYGGSYNTSNKKFNYDITLINNHNGINEFKLSNITIKLYQRNTLIEERDITNVTQVSDGLSTTNYRYSNYVTFDPRYSLRIEVIIEDQLGTHTLNSETLYTPK